MTRKKLALCITAGLLVIALLAGLLTNWFGFYGPAKKVISASKNTLEAKSFSVQIDLNAGAISLSGELQVQINTDQRTLSAALINEEDEITFAIYQNHLIFSIGFLTYAKDISGPLNRLFDILENDSEIDWAKLLQDIAPELYGQIGDDLDFDKVDSSMLQLYRKFNSEHWLKKNAGWSEEKKDGLTLYRFEPDTAKFLQSSLKCFKKVFRSSERYEALMDELGETASVDLNIELGLKNGLLDSFRLSANDSIDICLNFTDIGSTSINERDLERTLKRAIKIKQ